MSDRKLFENDICMSWLSQISESLSKIESETRSFDDLRATRQPELYAALKDAGESLRIHRGIIRLALEQAWQCKRAMRRLELIQQDSIETVDAIGGTATEKNP